MSSTIYMTYRSVHKKNPIKIGEREKLVWGGGNEYVLTHTLFSGGVGNSVYTHFSEGKSQYVLIFPGRKLSIYSFFRGENEYVTPVLS